MTQLTSLFEIVKRLPSALHLLKLAEEVIPTLVSRGATTAESAKTILGQIPALRADIEEEIASAKRMMRSIQDRVEALAQFLLLHRGMLTAQQSAELDRQLKALKGEDDNFRPTAQTALS
jgi:polyhydroxyalkanoate synthesis regulator phasin